MSSIGAGEAIRFILQQTIEALVEQTQSVQVRCTAEASQLVFVVYAAESDLGMLIGRSGRTARALRTLLHALAAKNRVVARLELPGRRDREEVESSESF